MVFITRVVTLYLNIKNLILVLIHDEEWCKSSWEESGITQNVMMCDDKYLYHPVWRRTTVVDDENSCEKI